MDLLFVEANWNDSISFLSSLAADLANEDYQFVFKCLAAIVSIAVLLYVLCSPLNIVKDLCDTGYGHQISTDTYGKSKRQIVNEVRRLKKRGDIPPIYPNGWFAILESDDLKSGQVRSVNAIGENLVAFRTAEGKACVLDAYCPHLGAHLGIGGRVVGDCIECPFHGWQFRGNDGRCTSIPYAKKVPEFSSVKSWLVEEKNGFIFLWYHAENEDPLWYVPAIPQIETKRWKYIGRTDYKINSHIQEIPENGADLAHLGHLHGPSMVFGSDLRNTSHYGAIDTVPGDSDDSVLSMFKMSKILRHNWDAQWKPLEGAESHMAISTLHHDLRLLGRFRFFNMDIEAKQIGAGLVHLSIGTTLGPSIVIQTVTPVEPLVQRVIHRMYIASPFVTPYAKFVLWGEALMFERDVMIWNHKTYVSRPLLVSEDKTLVKHRRWYQQFYSDNSPRFEFQKAEFDW